ncbi:Methyltransferase domain-containing protein [Methylophilus rhizosphaerae]|uniref:Methyltransferase domain-containing protein n=1 Tax=Methylophilus rhizosphaerae TaxID=492660 RepID=A0A1G8ZD22_9PROT|nr:class I SAM-dependent methyltransferase [Methylophilus rhizosphaerae]SDK12999.1 Methyltransferase domain-containing protein [Methylophilus rhizosphaerae]
MSNLWQQIWEKRTLQPQHAITLDTLISLDGFDSGAGKINPADWQEYTRRISEKLGLKPGDSVFEVGCGAGAFLFALRQQFALEVGGLDYTAGLIEAAQQAMPDGDFHVQAAQSLETEPAYDFVIANSVFHYFDEVMAAQVLQAMWKKSRHGIAILDIPNAATRDACELARREALTQAEYEEKYKGLHHTYFTPEWFTRQLPERSHQVFQSCVPNYAQSEFRFSVIFSKHLHG